MATGALEARDVQPPWFTMTGLGCPALGWGFLNKGLCGMVSLRTVPCLHPSASFLPFLITLSLPRMETEAEEMGDVSFTQVWASLEEASCRKMGSSGFNAGPAPGCDLSLDKFPCLLYWVLNMESAEIVGGQPGPPHTNPHQGTGGYMGSTSASFFVEPA